MAPKDSHQLGGPWQNPALPTQSAFSSRSVFARAIIRAMLRLRLTNPVPVSLPHLAPFSQSHPEFPLKSRIEPKTGRTFQVISLPQKDGSFVASVLEAPAICAYDRSRKAAEEKASQKFLKTPDLLAFKRHPLATSKDVTIDMEYDPDAAAFVTYVEELHRMSSSARRRMPRSIIRLR
jgi:hypothetical protein